ncbi:hypothetical protein EDB85DRAFT_1892751 [Lactarius pseudohatsudake]|nr:hypothetical protein EDB85DRAFT_1892751 [Lactarius pseudohatsudake]
MRSQEKTRLLFQATHEDLFGAQNPVYVHLYTENLKLTASHETLEKAFQALVSSGPPPPAVPIDEIDEPPTDQDPMAYPDIKYWFKHLRRAEFNRRKEFSKGRTRRGPAPAGENREFWFLEDEDGTMLDGYEVARIRAESKVIWESMCKKYGRLGLPWGRVGSERHREFWQRIEAKPILSQHKITPTDWYQARYPDSMTPKASGQKRSRTASPVSQKSPRCSLCLGPRSRQRSSDEEEEEDSDLDKEENGDNNEDEADDSTPSIPTPPPPPARPKARSVTRRTRGKSSTTDDSTPSIPTPPPPPARPKARSVTRRMRGKSSTSPLASRSTINTLPPPSSTAPSTQPAPLNVPTKGGNMPVPREDENPTASGPPGGLSGPPETQHIAATTSGCGTEASITILNPLYVPATPTRTIVTNLIPSADIIRSTPTPFTSSVPPPEGASIQAHEGPGQQCDSAGTNNDTPAILLDTTASTPVQVAEGTPPESAATNDAPVGPGPLHEPNSTITADDPATTPTDPATNAPTPGAASSSGPSEAASTSNPINKSGPKTKAKKAGIMRPGKTTTARNLYTIDFLKDHPVTCEEFARVWNDLDKDTHTMYTRHKHETKKKSAGSTLA